MIFSVIEIALEKPALGQVRVANELTKRGLFGFVLFSRQCSAHGRRLGFFFRVVTEAAFLN